MIKGCQDATDRGIFEFDDLIMEMFDARKDKNRLIAIEAYIIKNKYDYCLIHLVTLINCCKGYILVHDSNK